MHAAHERQARDREAPSAEGARGARPSWALGRCRPPPPPCPDTDSQARTHRRRPLPLCDCADAAPAPTHTHTHHTRLCSLLSTPTSLIAHAASSPHQHQRQHTHHLIITHTLASSSSHHHPHTGDWPHHKPLPLSSHIPNHPATRMKRKAQRQPAPIPSTREGRRHVAPRSPLARPLRAR